jgi:hypothetical protein
VISRSVLGVALATAFIPCGRADITLRYTFNAKLASFLPAEVQAQTKQQMGSALPSESTVRIKGDKAASSAGPLTSIADYKTGEFSLLDPKTKRFTTVGMSEFADKLMALQKPPAIPPEAQQLLSSMKVDVQSKKTGQIGLIQGIQADETLITVSMQMSGLPGAAATMMRMEIRGWLAQPNEIRRVPALQELADYSARATKAMDPAEIVQKMLAQFPGLGDQMRTTTQEILKLGGSLMVKYQMALYIPAMAQAMQLQGAAVPGLDANAPFVEMQMDLADISTTTIPDSVFAIPADYQKAAFEEVAQVLVQASLQAPLAAPTRK